MEWLSESAQTAVTRTLTCIADFYRLKNAEAPTKSEAENARKYAVSAGLMARGEMPKQMSARALMAAHAAGIAQIGDPVADWLEARRLLHDIGALKELYREVRLVRLFRATDALASSLGSRWLASGGYMGATDLVRRILDQEKLIAADRDPEG